MENLIHWLVNNAGVVIPTVLVLFYFGSWVYLKYANYKRVKVNIAHVVELIEKSNLIFNLRKRSLTSIVICMGETYFCLNKAGLEVESASDGYPYKGLVDANIHNTRRLDFYHGCMKIDSNGSLYENKIEGTGPVRMLSLVVTYSPDGRDWLFRDKNLKQEVKYFF